MRQQIKFLLNKTVSLFDKNGGVRSVANEYLTNWWDVLPITVSHVGKKSFYLRDSSGKHVPYRYTQILEIKNNEITIST